MPTRDQDASRPRTLLWLGAGVLVAVVCFFAYGKGFPNSDQSWTLVWGRQLLELETPTYPGGPTPHPLTNLLGMAAALFHPPSEALLQVAGYASVSALILGAFTLGRTLFGTAAGVLAAVLVATRDALLFYGALAFVDVMFAALVIWAVALEASRPRRGVPVLILLGLAGLARPEAWLLAGMYWLYARPSDARRAVAWGALVVSAPLLWIGWDWAVTGDPLYSYNFTKTASEVSGRPTGLSGLVSSGAPVLARTVRPEICIAAVVGFFVAYRDRRFIPLTAVIAVLGLAPAIQVVGGTALEDRHLIPLMAMLCVLAAAPLSLLRGSYEPRAWRLAAAGCLALLLVGAVVQVPRLMDRRDSVVDRTERRTHARELVQAGIPCYPVVIPHARWTGVVASWLDVTFAEVRDAHRGVPPGSYLWGTPAAMQNLVVIEGVPGQAAPKPAAPVIRRDHGWVLEARCRSRAVRAAPSG